MIKNLVNIVSKVNINLNEKDVLTFLKNEKRWPPHYTNSQPSVEIINELGTKSMDFFETTRDGTFLNYDKWYELYENGYTTIISNVLDLNDELRNLRSLIKKEIGINICGNFYFGRPGKKASFDKHSHPYNVIVKQIYGKSKWLIGENKFVLEPNQTCLIPKNTGHAVIEKTENKLSLTLNIE
jgi:oxalate decarboxylase/phosphoglucose isomerase-like protein (cupin superfamily)